jgi:nucleotidyltransferase/DNA polymerase involved in DNA repair
MRSILHVDMDQFYAAVEVKRRPELRGKPVIVGSDPQGGRGRGVVSTASYEARRFGVHSALPISTAWRLCPQGVFLPVDMPAYIAESERIHRVFESLTPLVEPLSLDEAFLDVSGSRLTHGDGPACAAWVQAQIQAQCGLSCSVGVAPNKFLAKVASDLKKPGGIVVVEAGHEAEFLAPLPVGRLWGVGKVAEAKLQALGIQRIGQLAAWPLGPLEAALGGAWARHLAALARGEDERPVQSEQAAKSVGREQTFHQDTRDVDLLRQTVADLSEDVAARLRRHGWACATLQLKYRFEGFETHTHQQAMRPPSDHGPELFRAAWAALDAVLAADARRLRLVGISASCLAGALQAQAELFGPDRGKQRRVDAALDSIRDRHGDAGLRRANQGIRP